MTTFEGNSIDKGVIDYGLNPPTIKKIGEYRLRESHLTELKSSIIFPHFVSSWNQSFSSN